MKKFLGVTFALMLALGVTSCKPKQSAYQSVYQAAKERQIQENTNTAVAPARPAPTTAQAETPAVVRRERVTAVDESDPSVLKAFSVVVAALSVKPNADALKARLQNDGLDVILAQNENGMYRVIVGSYDDRVLAEAKRAEIVNKYSLKGDVATLRKTYGIPFNDLWILQRLY